MLQLLEQVQRMVVMGQQFLEGLRRGGTRVQHVFDMRLDFMRMLAQAHGAGHARAALDRMQGTQQHLRLAAVVRLLLPAAQRLADLRQQVGALFQEDGQEIEVEFIADAGAGRQQRGRIGRHDGGRRRFRRRMLQWRCVLETGVEQVVAGASVLRRHQCRHVGSLRLQRVGDDARIRRLEQRLELRQRDLSDRLGGLRRRADDAGVSVREQGVEPLFLALAGRRRQGTPQGVERFDHVRLRWRQVAQREGL
ncbi:hypothetical protein D3C85_625370 [compost metagenome]